MAAATCVLGWCSFAGLVILCVLRAGGQAGRRTGRQAGRRANGQGEGGGIKTRSDNRLFFGFFFGGFLLLLLPGQAGGGQRRCVLLMTAIVLCFWSSSWSSDETEMTSSSCDADGLILICQAAADVRRFRPPLLLRSVSGGFGLD